jgi:nifR3 family TIM-barrel protein
MRIGGVIVDPPLALAPMAGVGDVHFRRLVRGFGGVGLVVTEFALAEGLAERDPRALAKLRFAEDERPVAVQILGADPETARRAAAVAQSLEPDLCDLNLGCPMRKITRRGAGVALMDEPERAARLIEACRRELSVPLTLKLRLGRREGPEGETYQQIARIAEELGVAAIALHPRSGRALYDGRADWRHVGRLVGAVGIPVIGNGDVRAPEDAVRRKRETGCDGVMIGRAAIARPWIFRQVAAMWEGRGEPGMEPAQARRALLEGLREIAREQPEPVARHRLRCFAGRYAKEEPGTAALGRGLGRARDTREILDLLADHLDPDRAASNA